MTSKTPAKQIRDLEGFDALIAKRAESTGSDGKTFTVPGFGRDWDLAAPDLQSAEWNDRYSEMHSDLQDRIISTADYRVELVDLFLGDQADDFLDACDKAGVDAAQMVNLVLQQYREDLEENPTRPNSRSVRRRAKRR